MTTESSSNSTSQPSSNPQQCLQPNDLVLPLTTSVSASVAITLAIVSVCNHIEKNK